MLKLFKHNSKYLYKAHFIITAVVFVNILLFFILNTISKTFDNEALIIFNSLISLLTSITSMLMFGSFIVTFILICVNFKRKVLGDEGYLTHTLPISKNAIIGSYYLTALVYLIYDIIILILGLFLTSLIDGTYYQNTILIEGFGAFELVLLFVLIFIVYFVYLSYVLLAFSLGYSKADKKIRNTILYGIVIYLANQVITSIPVVVIISIALNITNVEMIQTMTRGILIGISLYYLLIGTLSYILINRTIKKKLNLE